MRHRFTEPTPVDSTVEIVSIRIAAWEIECCASPPQVGGQSTWQLLEGESDGHVWGTAHGGKRITRTVTGTVLSVHLLTQNYRQDAVGVWRPVPSSAVLQRIWKSPRWFRGSERLQYGEERRVQTGVAIELAVPRGTAVPNVASSAEYVFLADL
ncbi:DUF6578 domain-containing protein [Rhodococcus kronopolitis]|uniref:DUF6578 domain-containing protein n=1 Tax=Rhodococcus kronopolitis TaxID=1460226 RepID=A0ABV9FXE6_9NOCA